MPLRYEAVSEGAKDAALIQPAYLPSPMARRGEGRELLPEKPI